MKNIIAMRMEDLSIRAIVCGDDYPVSDEPGETLVEFTLKEYYNSDEIVTRLLALGPIKALAKTHKETKKYALPVENIDKYRTKKFQDETDLFEYAEENCIKRIFYYCDGTWRRYDNSWEEIK